MYFKKYILIFYAFINEVIKGEQIREAQKSIFSGLANKRGGGRSFLAGGFFFNISLEPVQTVVKIQNNGFNKQGFSGQAEYILHLSQKVDFFSGRVFSSLFFIKIFL